MSRPVDWTPLADRDPIPGDPDRLEEAGRHYKRVALAIENAATKLRRLADRADMQSEAVDTFRDRARGVADKIGRAHDRYASVGIALADYAESLRTAQKQSLDALEAARRAQATELSATRAAEGALSRVTTPPLGADTTADVAAHLRANRAAEDASGELATAHRLLGEAVDARDAAAGRALRLIRNLDDADGLDDGWRENVGGFLAKHLKPILPWIDAIAAAVGVLAFFLAAVPFVGAGLGALALSLAAVSFVGHALLTATGEDGWKETVIAGVGLATFGLGKIAAGGYKVSAYGARGAARGVAGRWAARSPGTRGAAGLPAHADSAKAVDEMMGSGAWMDRTVARAAADRSVQDGVLSVREAGRNLRDIPGRAVDDIRGMRNFDPRHPVAQVHSLPMSNKWNYLADPEAAAAARALNEVHPVIRASPELASHLKQMGQQQTAYLGAYLGGAGILGYEAVTLGTEPSPAQKLRLGQVPVTTGGR